jgi:hypothetical protein
MKPRFYKLLEESIEAGAKRGYVRAFKHTDSPKEEAIIESITNCIMGELHENFEFDDD